LRGCYALFQKADQPRVIQQHDDDLKQLICLPPVISVGPVQFKDMLRLDHARVTVAPDRPSMHDVVPIVRRGARL